MCLERAVQLYARLDGAPDATSAAAARSVRALVAGAHTDLAALALATGDRRETAVAELRLALALHPAPEILADAIRVRPEMAPLSDDPVYRGIVGLSP
jgi:hypothetical protein